MLAFIRKNWRIFQAKTTWRESYPRIYYRCNAIIQLKFVKGNLLKIIHGTFVLTTLTAYPPLKNLTLAKNETFNI